MHLSDSKIPSEAGRTGNLHLETTAPTGGQLSSDNHQDLFANTRSLEEDIRFLREEVDSLQRELQWHKEVLQQRDEGIAWLHSELKLAQEELNSAKKTLPRRIAAKVSHSIRGVVSSQIVNPHHRWQWLGYQRWYWQLRALIRRVLSRLLPASILRRMRKRPEFVPPASLPSLPFEGDTVVDEKPTTLRSLTLLPHLAEKQLSSLTEQHWVGTPVHRPDVICFSIIDWDFRYQRPQQIMSQFAAQGHRVFYLSTTHFLPSEANPRVAVRQIKKNIYEVTLAAQRTPDVYGELIEGKNQQELLNSLADLRRTFQIDAAIAYVMIASWGEVALAANQRWGWQTIYDCMDEWESFPGIKPAILKMERRLVKESDQVVVTAQRLYDKWEGRCQSLTLARNGVDYDFFDQHCQPNSLLPSVKHPIIGYYGAIADWFDLALMEYIAGQRPDYTFILLGGLFKVDVSRLRKLPNVIFLGQQPYETMPQYLHHFDACIIPFKINQVTDATDPVKLYEYLSGGKPVVAVPMPELKPYSDYVYLAEDQADFVAKLDQALAEDSPVLAEQRKAFARQHTWEKRYRDIYQGLVAVTPKASVIIVTWRNLVLTKLCLESVLRNTEYTNYEIIVVDNNSDDGTPDYLREMAERHSNVKIILNDVNYGFAKANNQGIDISEGEYVVLLNNDTIVPPGWLNRLLRHLQDPKVGVVGPVTNAVGNEAKVSVSYRTWAEMESYVKAHTWAYDLQVADIFMLAMFCVALRRETLDKIGPLDEQFGIGMFEDDDYSQRIKAAGLRVICAADVFVHHFGQAAFKQLIASGSYNLLFEENRRRFEDKWKTRWVPHKHASLLFEVHNINSPQPKLQAAHT